MNRLGVRSDSRVGTMSAGGAVKLGSGSAVHRSGRAPGRR